MPVDPEQLAAKSDIAAVKSELKSDIAAVKSELKSDIAAAKFELKSDIAALDGKLQGVEKRLDAKIDRVAMDVVRTGGKIEKLEEGLRADMRRLEATVTGKLESFACRMETIWRESATLPRLVDEHAKTLQTHEARITTLETSREN